MNECDSAGGFLAQEFPQTSWRPGTQAVPGYQSRDSHDGGPLLPSCFLKVTQLVGEPFVENHFVQALPRRGICHMHHKMRWCKFLPENSFLRKYKGLG